MQAASPEDTGSRWVALPSLVQPKWMVIFEDPSSDTSPETTLKLADGSYLVEGHHSPSPSSDSNDTIETVDLTKPMAGDDCSGNSDETVDWSQSAGGDFGRPASLRPTPVRIPVQDRVTWQ